MSVLILHFYLLLKKFMGAQTKESTCIYLYGQFWKKFISNVVAQRRRLHRESGCHRNWIESKRGPGWAFLAGRGLRWTRCRPHNQWCPWKLLISVSIGSELFRTCTSSCKSSPSRHCGSCRSSSPRWLCSRSRCCSKSRQGRCCRRQCWRAGVQGWVVDDDDDGGDDDAGVQGWVVEVFLSEIWNLVKRHHAGVPVAAVARDREVDDSSKSWMGQEARWSVWTLVKIVFRGKTPGENSW